MFKLDERLEADSIEIDQWALSNVRLMNDANFPWLVLVPTRASIREVHELPAADRAQLIEEIARAAWALESMVKPHKINVAALGNQVPQLHVHVIARFTSDAAWPNPVWGKVEKTAYAAEAIETFKKSFLEAARIA